MRDKAQPAMFLGMPVSDWKMVGGLLLAGGLVAIWFGVQELFRVSEHKAVMARFKAAGVKAIVDEQEIIVGLEYIRGRRIDIRAGREETLPDVGFINLQDSQITDDELMHLAVAPKLHSLDLRGTRITDEGLALVLKYPKLQWLNLEGTAVTDHGLAYVGQLPELIGVTLDNTSVTDDGLRHLKTCRSLRTLSLNGTRIAGRGLEHLSGIPRLETLYLFGTQIDDDVVPYIAEIRGLYWLDVRQTKLSAAGQTQIRAAFPRNVHLNFGGRPPRRSAATEPDPAPAATLAPTGEVNPASASP